MTPYHDRMLVLLIADKVTGWLDGALGADVLRQDNGRMGSLPGDELRGQDEAADR